MRPGPFHASLHSRHVRRVVALLLAVAMLLYGSGGALLAAKGPSHHHRDGAPHGHLHFAGFSWQAMVHEGMSRLLGTWPTPAKAAKAATVAGSATASAEAPHPHPHFHGDAERHHHDARDGSVVVDGDPHAGDGSTLLAALSLPIAPPVQALSLPTSAANANGRWRPSSSDRWDDAPLPLLKRPPRV